MTPEQAAKIIRDNGYSHTHIGKAHLNFFLMPEHMLRVTFCDGGQRQVHFIADNYTTAVMQFAQGLQAQAAMAGDNVVPFPT